MWLLAWVQVGAKVRVQVCAKSSLSRVLKVGRLLGGWGRGGLSGGGRTEGY